MKIFSALATLISVLGSFCRLLLKRWNTGRKWASHKGYRVVDGVRRRLQLEVGTPNDTTDMKFRRFIVEQLSEADGSTKQRDETNEQFLARIEKRIATPSGKEVEENVK